MFKVENTWALEIVMESNEKYFNLPNLSDF